MSAPTSTATAGFTKIKSIAGVARTTRTVVLNTEFEGQPLKL